MQLEVQLIAPPSIKNAGQKTQSLKYEPLPTPTSIRLLKIERLQHIRDNVDLYRPLFCSLITKDLNDRSQYDALSYTWGDPLKRAPTEKPTIDPESWSAQSFEIHCDNRKVGVTTNLHSALLVLRYYQTVAVGMNFPRVSEYVWIDQICINQADIAEKSSQVLLMSRIYRQAYSVQVWLGGNDMYANDFQYVTECLEPLDLENPERYKTFRIFQSRSYDELGIKRISPKQWRGAYAFLCRAWFYRSWIVQEVALASHNNAFCGLRVIALGHLLNLWMFLDNTKWLHQISCDPAVKRRNLWPQVLFAKSIANLTSRMGIGEFTKVDLNRGNPHSLFMLARIFRSTEATDARDKIYSFLHLSKEFADQTKNCIVPDYNRSVVDVYVEATRLFTSSDGWNLSCFSIREDESHRRIAALPSWVTDFSIQTGHNPLITVPVRWSAGGLLNSHKIQYLPGHALKLHGKRVDIVRCLEFLDVALLFQGEQRQGNTTEEVMDLLKYGLIQVLQRLPEVSVIQKPPEYENVPECFRESYESPVSSQRSLTASATQDTGGGPYTCQSRYEIFWRTMLRDYYQDHPAPDFCGKTILEDIEEAFDMKLASALSYTVPKVQCPQTGYIDWKYMIEQIGKDYTTLRILQGSHPYHSNEVIYPPGFKPVMKSLGLSWNSIESIKDPERVSEYCNMVERRAQDIFTPDEERLTVRSRLIAACMGRVLFATDGGRIGTGLLSTEIEDEVWLLTGSPVPCLLRPVGNGRYILVGEAYVHGIMHGEALKELDEEAYQEVIIV